MEEAPGHPLWIALAGLAALAAAMGIGRFAFTPLLPMMQREGLLSLAAGGWLASANYAGYFAGALSAVFLPIPPTAAIRGGLLAIAVTTLAMAFTDSMTAWIVLRTLAGIASAWVLVFGSAWTLERLSAAGRPGLGAVVFTGVGAGIAIAGLACLVLLRQDATASTGWVVLGAIALLLALATWPRFRAAAARPAFHERASLSARGFLKLLLCYGALGFGYIVPATFLPAMAREAIPDPMLFGWTWPFFGAAAGASTLVAAPIARAFGYRRVWIGANILMAIGVAIPLASTGLAALLASALLVGGTFMVITMAGLQEARRASGAKARELIAAMTCAFALGQILGPIVVSLSVARGAYAPALAAAAVVLLLSAAALSMKEERR